MERKRHRDRQRKGKERGETRKWHESKWETSEGNERNRVKDGAAGKLSKHGCVMHFPYGAVSQRRSFSSVPCQPPASDLSCHSWPLEHDINGPPRHKQA